MTRKSDTVRSRTLMK